MPLLVGNTLEEGGSSVLNTLVSGEQNSALSNQNYANSFQQLRYSTDNNNQNAIASRNFMGQQFQSNRDLTSNLFNQGQTNAMNMQSASFANQQKLQTNALSSNRSNMAMLGGMNMLGSVVGTIGGALLNSQSAGLQRQNFDYMTNKMQGAFTDAGLPSWLAFSPGSASMFPRTSQVVNGNNSFTSQLPGNPMASAWQGSPSQVTMGVGDIPTAF